MTRRFEVYVFMSESPKCKVEYGYQVRSNDVSASRCTPACIDVCYSQHHSQKLCMCRLIRRTDDFYDIIEERTAESRKPPGQFTVKSSASLQLYSL